MTKTYSGIVVRNLRLVDTILYADVWNFRDLFTGEFVYCETVHNSQLRCRERTD